MSSSASTLSNNNNNKEASVSVSSSGTKSTPSARLNDLGDQKVSTSSAASKSEPSIDSAAIASAATAVTPMKSQEEIASITESEEKNTSPAPSTASVAVDSSKQDTSAAVTTTLPEAPDAEVNATEQQNEDRVRLSKGINDLTSVKHRGPGRPSKKAPSPMSSAASSAPSSSSSATSPAIKTVTCAWCSEDKSVLKYVLPTPNGDKEFCSELCIAEFRKALKKGACSQCGNVVRPNVAPNREFCSTFCMNKVQTSASARNGKLLLGPVSGSESVQVFIFRHYSFLQLEMPSVARRISMEVAINGTVQLSATSSKIACSPYSIGTHIWQCVTIQMLS